MRDERFSDGRTPWRLFRVFMFGSSLVMLSLAAHPSLASTEDDLVKTHQQIKQAKHRQEDLKKERSQLESELVQLQQALVTASAKLQQRELALTEAEAKLERIESEKQAKEGELKTGREKLAAMIEAALRISRTPPEAMVLMPENGDQAVRAARILKMTTESIKTNAQQIRMQIVALNSLKEKIDTQRDLLLKEKQHMLEAQQQIEAQLSARRELQQKLSEDEQQQAETIMRLAKQAQSLQELVGKIELERQARAAQDQKQDAQKPPVENAAQRKLRSFVSARGRIAVPAAGRIIQIFGQPAGRNETSRGMVIKTRPQASVTAPYDGEVVYAGNFMGYGRLVILRHSDDFHTLLSGLSDINTRAGEFLLEGEPIGAMGDKESSTRLYLELRRDNQPVDPAAWIKN